MGPIIPQHVDELQVRSELGAAQQAILGCLEAQELASVFQIA